MDGQVFWFQIAVLVLVDAVSAAPQIVMMSLTYEEGVAQLKGLAQVDVVVVEAPVKGRRQIGHLRTIRIGYSFVGMASAAHASAASAAAVIVVEFGRRQIFRQVVTWRRRQVVVGALVGQQQRRRFVVVVVVVVAVVVLGAVLAGFVLGVEQRDDVVFLAEGPPPAEGQDGAETEPEVGLSLAVLELLHEGQDALQRFVGPPVVRHDGRLATKVEDSVLFRGVQSDFIQHQHPLGFAQNVVVERPFGDVVVRRGLRESHFLRHDRVNGFLQLFFGPRRSFGTPLDQRFCCTNGFRGRVARK